MAIDIKAEFEKYDDDFLKFEEFENKRSTCEEAHAFLLLNELLPESRMICAAEHDQIWLATDCEKLAEVATSKHIEELARCGVFYDEDGCCLSMFR